MVTIVGGVKIVGGADKVAVAFGTDKTGMIGISQREFGGGGEGNKVFEIEFDSVGFFNFFQGGKMSIFDTVGEDDGIGGDSSGKKNFSLGEIGFEAVNQRF